MMLPYGYDARQSEIADVRVCCGAVEIGASNFIDVKAECHEQKPAIRNRA